MRSWNLIGYALMSCAASALLAGCAFPLSLSKGQGDMLPGTMHQGSTIAARTNSTSYTVVYSFRGGHDGSSPSAGLINVGGTLYGTTQFGGGDTGGYCVDYPGCGTVFSVTPSGPEKVLHSFGLSGDGAFPVAGLIDVGGTLYGTTSEGGAYVCGIISPYFGCGTVFSITTSGTEKVLYSFGQGDGSDPVAPLTDVKGTLYGTAYEGGPYALGCRDAGYRVGCGTIFTITTGGTEAVLYDFQRQRHAHWPQAGLIDAGRKLYGTTSSGGAYGGGTVFSITLGGKEKILHSFGNGTDGGDPTGSLIEVKGTFYGTTSSRGAYGGGTVFSITPSGTEKVLHSFGAGTDGISPLASLIDVKGTLYGTTIEGGAYQCFDSIYCGTVFSITTSGTEEVLHSFGNGTDGVYPVASLIELKGKLYGTTTSGGAYGQGTVFALTP